MKAKSILILTAIVIIALNGQGQVTGTFTDSRDGKIYKTLKIGTQTWMVSDLAYEGVDGYIVGEYGHVYNWDAAIKAAPAGWHLPSKDEWKILFNNLGKGSRYQKLKDPSFNFNATYKKYIRKSSVAVDEEELTSYWTSTPCGPDEAKLFMNGWYTITSYTSGSTGNQYPVNEYTKNSKSVKAFVRYIEN